MKQRKHSWPLITGVVIGDPNDGLENGKIACLLSMSQTLNVIAWIATMLLIVGVPACQLTWNILTTPTEQDDMLEKNASLRTGPKHGLVNIPH
jgi:hypothetical protein